MSVIFLIHRTVSRHEFLSIALCILYSHFADTNQIVWIWVITGTCIQFKDDGADISVGSIGICQIIFCTNAHIFVVIFSIILMIVVWQQNCIRLFLMPQPEIDADTANGCTVHTHIEVCHCICTNGERTNVSVFIDICTLVVNISI